MKKVVACVIALAALYAAGGVSMAWDCPRPTVFNPRSLDTPPFLYGPPGMIRLAPPIPRDRASRLRPIPVPMPPDCGPAWVKGGCVVVEDTAICW